MELSLQDVQLLQHSPSAETRALIARKICEQYKDQIFNEKERDIAREILRLIARDLEVAVRKVVVTTLKASSDLPHDVALLLANDSFLEISIPILEFSPVLTDEDLNEIIRSAKQTAKLEAIAKREHVSYGVSSSLIHKGNEASIRNLITNRNSQISEQSLYKIIEDFRYRENILENLVERGGLSLTIVEKLTTVVSQKLRKQLVEKYNISSLASSEATEAAHDEVIVNMAQAASAAMTENLVSHLYQRQKLNPTIIMRALCRGDVEFFECSIAKLAQIPRANAHKLIWESGLQGFGAVYKAAAMPEQFFEAARIILFFISEEVKEQGDINPHDFSQRLLEYITTRGLDKSVTNMPFFITLIRSASSKPSSSAATVH